MFGQTLLERLENGLLAAVTFERLQDALPTAEAFLEAGLPIMEVPLRTKQALEAINLIKVKFPEITIGAGTILNQNNLNDAINAGAEFGLAPGLNIDVVNQASSLKFPFIPGAMTPSEIELGISKNCEILKLFPIENLGGIKFLESIDAPYSHTNIKYIPMGGINLNNMNHYLSNKSVIAVGGSWLASKKILEASDFSQIKQNITEALNKINNSKGA